MPLVAGVPCTKGFPRSLPCARLSPGLHYRPAYWPASPSLKTRPTTRRASSRSRPAQNNEIEISKWAESKCTNDECREFAQRMVRDHTPGCEEMKQLAGNLATHGQGQSGRAAAGGHQGQLDWVAIKHQIGEQCLASLKK